MKILAPPSFKESLYCLTALVLWFVITVLFLGFQPERIALAVFIILCFFVSVPSRKLLLALLPFILFGISYDWMNLLPNYKVNDIHTSVVYNLEKYLFGIKAGASLKLTPNEFFAIHNSPVFDFLSGVFYLCWVPVPVIFGLYLYFNNRCENYLHFAIVFLFVNLLGFTFYYVFPSAPPWYIELYGFNPVTDTPGNVAGLGAFDQMTGLSVFDGLYAKNSNVFAAMPSLHSAYPFVAFIYSLSRRTNILWKIGLGIVTVGIWFAAVYTSHHYILDVLGGITVSLLGIFIFELILMRIPSFSRFIKRYSLYISLKPNLEKNL